ncbi:MAG: DUF3467 domain-containing protein [Patescibacteria group bacterium]
MNEQNQQPASTQGGQIQIKASDSDLKGVYSNMMQVAHTQEEFVIDFMNITPPVGVLASRVIVSPSHVKRIIAALADNLKKYEENFGNVASASETPQKIGFKLD